MTSLSVELGDMFSIVFRASVLLSLTTLMTVLFRRRSPAVTHLAWTGCMVGCLVLPWVTLFSPQTRLAILPPQSTEATQFVRDRVRPTSIPAVVSSAPDLAAGSLSNAEARSGKPGDRIGTGSSPKLNSPAFVVSPTSVGIKDTPDQESVTASPVAHAGHPWLPGTIGQGAAWVWCIGFLFSLFGMVRQAIRTRHVLAACDEVVDASVLTAFASIQKRLKVRRSVALRVHRRFVSPMVVGSLRPVVVLPPDARTWSTSRLELVLAHELFHVRRWDVLTQSMASLACAVYWFQPLVWWGAREMRRTREQSCDDLVLMNDGQPGLYAETLLDIAKRKAFQEQAFSVAMARVHQVESRISAILDRNRSRKPTTKRVTVGLLTIMVALTMITGTVRLTSQVVAASPQVVSQDQAVSQNQDQAVSQNKDSSGDLGGTSDVEERSNVEFREMQVSILDEAGEPIPQAKLLVSVWEIERTGNFPTQTYAADDSGRVTIVIPPRLRILRLWPSKEGYVPQFMNFAKGQHQEGRQIPDSFEFRLQKGTRVGGRVVADNGNPIEGATVQVVVDVKEPPWTHASRPIVSRWLANGSSAVTTDKEGRWKIDNAPQLREEANQRIQLMIKHPSYVGDTRWGELQERQGVTDQQLRDGTAKVILPKGIAVHGKVTGPEGEPVTQGLIVWSENPYFANGTFESTIQENGTYSTAQLSPGEYPITVLAPGYSPDQRVVSVQEGLQPLDFQLAKGNRLTLEIVDTNGIAIPHAHVQLGYWRGTESMYNQIHPNVPPTGIPTRANERGIYEWSWAPGDAVQYSIQAAGYDGKEVTLIAKENAHRVVLPALIRIRGTVLDAETRQPIERFQVVPVKAFRPDFYSTDFQDPGLGKDGRYEIKINSLGQKGNRYRVRISADGYRNALGTKSLAAGDPVLREDFLLERTPALVGMVQAPNGEAEKDYVVAVGTATTAPHFDLDQPRNEFGVTLKVRNQYQFELPATFETRRIRVYNQKGFAEVVREPEDDIGIIQLQPWAKVSGRLMNGNQPIANEYVYFYPVIRRGLTEARFQDSFAVKTDLQGHFSFQQLPPMAGSLKPYLGPWQKSVMTSAESAPLILRPGVSQEISLGSPGATVRGKVIAKGRKNEELSKNWSLNYLIHRDQGIEYPDSEHPLAMNPLDPTGPLNRKQLAHPDFSSWLSTRSHHFVKLAEDGEFTIHGVRPGNHDLVIQLYEQPAGCLVETIGQSIVSVSVSDSQAEGEVLDLGTLEVECRSGPRVGSDMRSYEFVNAEQELQTVNDSQGKHVLFHVWASWCQPCLASMPELKAFHESAGGGQLQLVGLNMDVDKDLARSLANRSGWKWAHNYLGEESALIQQLAVSSAPAYFLIGPDGKLLASANQWETIQKLLVDSLQR